MGLLSKISKHVFGANSSSEISDSAKKELLRRCYFEVMEERRVLSVDPVVAGITYLEGDAGQDTTPDHFEVTFQGGAETTTMTQFVVNGDQDQSGDRSDGDMFFDATDAAPGTGDHHGFQFDAANSQGVSASDITGFSVSDDGLVLTVDVANFEAGDVLAFTIDVDEVERFKTDKIASGVEFEGSVFSAEFIDQQHTFVSKDIAINATLEEGQIQPQEGGIFYDEYNELFAEGEAVSKGELDLTLDNEEGKADRTAAAIDAYDLIPKPITISGTVYHDENLNCEHDSDESGIGGVEIQLQKLDETSGNYVTVATTKTDASGNYEFGEHLGIVPGEFKLVEVQPGGFLDVGVEAGTHGGNKGENVISEISVPLGGSNATGYDFKEVRPASLSGNVWHDQNDDGVFDTNERGIANVLIQVTRTGAKADVSEDPFEGMDPIFVRTDANGHYSVDSLPPGIYEVVEINSYPDFEVDPLAGYNDGKDSTGNVDGTTVGTKSNDKFTQVELCADDAGVKYNFGELKPAQISGYVSLGTPEGDCLDPTDPNHEGVGGVTIELYNDSGDLVTSTKTNADGLYSFDDLAPGSYTIVEVQPGNLLDGDESIGTVDGQEEGSLVKDDTFAVNLGSGDEGQNYNFCEYLPAELKGTVWFDQNNNGVQDSGEPGIANVKIELFDKEGSLIAQTVTDANGDYCFEGLVAGDYLVRQTQPTDYLDGKDSLGEVNGQTSGEYNTNDEFCVKLDAGGQGTNYDFGELLAAEIHGRVWEDGPAISTTDGVLPENYRDLRDGIYQEGVDTPLAEVRMELYYYLDPTNNNLVPRPVTLGEVDAADYAHMGTDDPNAPVWVETMANGEYWFTGLQPGSYIVLEQQPEGFFDSNDTEGTTTGFSYNSAEEAQTATASVISTFSTEQIMDSVVNIQVQSGGISELNNFSEVSITVDPVEPPVLPPPVNPPPSTPNPQPPGLGITGFPSLYGAQPSAFTQFVGTAGGASFQTEASATTPYTWHLSVVNAGQPRGADEAGDTQVWSQAGYIANSDWSRFDMDDAVWSFTETMDNKSIVSTNDTVRFGMLGGTPLAGDFDGDGIDEVAVFKDGFWMIDLNRNGNWDDGDLLARLGDSDDRPVVGDWDGDGKDDIGIYGPIWERDMEAIDREPGLPNPDNDPYTKPKNIPPTVHDATNGGRVMKLTSYGKQRADVVDHVFGIGDGEEVPVTGDWNGNGIRSIGTFQDGTWNLDINGDGRFDYEDADVKFGRLGDIPVVGDFNGDGVEEIAVFRSGTWIIDTNGNRELDATDKTFEMGGAGDLPVVGDWDGDGVDEPGLYTESRNGLFE